MGYSIASLLELVRKTQGPVNCTGLSGAEKAYVVYRLHGELRRPLLVVCADAREADLLAGDLRFFFGAVEAPLVVFPAYEASPFRKMAYDPETSCRRVGGLYRVMTGSGASIIIATVPALLQRVTPRRVLSAYAEYILPGEETERETLVAKLIQGGYQETILVEEPGDFAVRGGLIDVFPPLYSDPVRIEFFGDTVESIRNFSLEDQRSVGTLSELTLLPAAETVIQPAEIEAISARIRARGEVMELPGLRIEQAVDRVRALEQMPGMGGLLPLLFGAPDTLFDYLPEDLLPVLIEPAALEKRAIELDEKATRDYLAAFEEAHLCAQPEALYLPWPEILERLEARAHVTFRLVPVADSRASRAAACHFAVESNHLIREQLKARVDSDELLRPLVDWIHKAFQGGLSSYLICRGRRQAERLDELLGSYQLQFRVAETFPAHATATTGPCLCLGELSSGFVWADESMAIVTEDEIFGPKRRLPRPRKREGLTRWVALDDLKAGDLVVHTEHGVGRYNGLVTLELGAHTNDFLAVEYQDGDKLYVPVDRMSGVQKYVGVDGVAPRLDKMGGKSWDRVKERVKKSVQKIAGELLRLYAWRRVQQGHAFSVPDRHFREFEAAFEFTETPDQIRAIEDVLADMESPVPMDRLICGDVGYGKTEIALRAAFNAVWDNKQVAFLVPTTVLAEQHFQTFKMRFAPYPAQIVMLSRFRSGAEQRDALKGLKEGTADVVIGTHRLLQKDVAFKDLGLLIIDEEQRFGVAHKERIKQLRRNVDVLALTATPIPRTLHMSLMGIRDMSVIATPPEYRYAIKTYVCPFDDLVVAEAIDRELARNGQVFFVHNNIRTIWGMARRIQELIPHARIGVAHGRLDDEALEKVMLQFLHREIDVMVCTTIIESGLDFSSANTILINRADRFGLSQIYQLRGRVGRADEQAYAYLFIPDETALTRDAQKRLKVLMEHSDLGSGFRIAMSDLQIRGGGTILGPTQSGHVAAVGYDMYLQLMESAMAELKGEAVEQEPEPEIKIEASAYIPEDYIVDIDQRLLTYRRLARVAASAEIDGLRDELRDRFGPLPAETEMLFHKVLLKIQCKEIGVQRLDLGARSLVLSFSERHRADPRKIAALVQSHPTRYRLTPDYVLQARFPGSEPGDLVATARKILRELS